MTAWELMDETLRRSGMWDAETNWSRGGQDYAPSFEKGHFLDGFETPDRKFHFKPDWGRFGGRGDEMPTLPDHFDVIDNPTPDKPFRLVAAPARTFLNSTFTGDEELPSAREAADGIAGPRGLRGPGRERRRSSPPSATSAVR